MGSAQGKSVCSLLQPPAGAWNVPACFKVLKGYNQEGKKSVQRGLQMWNRKEHDKRPKVKSLSCLLLTEGPQEDRLGPGMGDALRQDMGQMSFSRVTELH